MAIDLQLPAGAEFEISLFGPGTGECIVAHLGQGDWMIVDSCIVRDSKEPVALEYLGQLGVPYEQVKIVLITHFHDDHIKGINRIIECCINAEICISNALTQDESFAYAMAHAQSDVLVDRDKPSTHELNKVVELMNLNSRSFTWASEAKTLYRRGDVLVNALSPSDRAVSQSKLDFAQGFEDVRNSFRKLAKKLTPNLCAVALHICNGREAILLGSDLETSGTTYVGWEAVVASLKKPTTLARVFKVPHHGSITGHSDDVVKTMLIEKPISIMTTMNTHHLPLPTDLERIKAYSESVYHTTQPLQKPPKRERAVEEMLDSVVKSRKVISSIMGHIQIRFNQGVVSVRLNNHARQAA